MGFYASSAPGIGGILKQTPEDFRVRELSSYPKPDPAGPYTVLRLESRDWEQHELAQQIARRLRVPAQGIRWAGTKDRRAIAERILSYPGLPPLEGDLGLPGVSVLEAYRTREAVVLGHHYGNAFEIRIHRIEASRDAVLERVAQVNRELAELGGFPNFFGPQRFGEVRPITHEVGRELVRGNVADAVDLYLTATPPGESPLGTAARLAYADHHDPMRGLREFPPNLRFERLLLDHLARGHTPARALRALGRPLRVLFVHAYQSYLFNLYLTERRRAALSLTSPLVGDYVLRSARDGTVPGTGIVPVGADNLAEVRDQTTRGQALLAAPLVGHTTPVLGGSGGGLFEALLERDGVRRDQFRVPAAPEISSAGSWRPLLTLAPTLRLFREGESDPADPVAELHFSLPRGSYATVLLRELIKRGATRAEALPAAGGTA